MDIVILCLLFFQILLTGSFALPTSNVTYPAFATRVFAGVTVPDTPAINASLAFARAHSSDLVYNHVVRSWLFGTIIANKLPSLEDTDREVHAVSALLHDLGWDNTGELVSKDKRFEIDGAIAAREFLQREIQPQWEPRRLQLVFDSIALHTTSTIAVYKEPEVAVCNMGIDVDFTGPDGSPNGTITWEEFDAVNKEYPRLRFFNGTTEIFLGLCRTKPETTYDNFLSDFGEAYIPGFTRKGHTLVDVVANSTLPDSF